MTPRTIIIAEQDSQTVEELMGVDRETADFYLAIERGEISGDAFQEESVQQKF